MWKKNVDLLAMGKPKMISNILTSGKPNINLSLFTSSRSHQNERRSDSLGKEMREKGRVNKYL